jgi:hypothetical protein
MPQFPLAPTFFPYRCPYYRTAEQDLWGRLLDVSSPVETKYWSNLANVAVDSSNCDSTFVQVSTWQLQRTWQDLARCQGLLKVKPCQIYSRMCS